MRLYLAVGTLALAGLPNAFGAGLGLCNTGVTGTCAGTNGLGTGPATQGGPESHWILAGGSAVVPTDAVIPASWVSNASSTASQWISPTLSTNAAGGVQYSYSINFNIPLGANLSTAIIAGRYLSDNETVNVFLNSTVVSPFPLNGTPSGFQQWTSFTISPGNGVFVPLANSLRFVVQNGGSSTPQGLRVEFFESSVSDAPEPGTLLMGGIGLVGIGLARLRRWRRRAG